VIRHAVPILAAVVALLAGAQAQAHAHLVASNPAAWATVAAPKSVHLKFNEKLEAKFSGCELTTAAGAPVAVTAKATGDSLDATPKAPLAPGAYKLNWHVLSVDGHKVKGVLNFTVR